jgi:polyhydroxybutyrate depolymerase
LAEDIARDLAIDPARMYVTGFSNGGFMTQRVACEDPAPWAAFASVGANLFPDFIALCADKAPTSMLIMHGTADQSIPWGGKKFGLSVQFYPTPYTAGFWANHAGCTVEPVAVEEIPKSDPAAETQASIYSYGDCDPGAEVLFFVIEGGGHNLPGLDRLDPAVAGAVNMDISAPDVIWAFFERHTLSDTISAE